MNKFESSPVSTVFERCIRTIATEKKVKVVAGVSGGPDSMALLYLLHRFGIHTTAVHCNYQLRGQASDQDQDLVEQMCMLWEKECVSVRLDSNKSRSYNFQDWAREERYRIFREIKTEAEADFILTAHHQDDQMETIFQKILRGAGVDAWSGMEILDGDLFRPLLTVPKDKIMKFVQDFNIPYRIDSSNEESTYARNFLRQNWFPILDRFFPGWRENILSIPRRSKEFELMASELLKSVLESPEKLNRKRFLALPEEIKPAILLQFIRNTKTYTAISKGFLNSVSKLEALQSGKKIQVGQHMFLSRDREFFLLVEAENPNKAQVTIKREDLSDAIYYGEIQICLSSFSEGFNGDVLQMDAGKILFPVTLRGWESGDTFQPFGMKGTQLVSDHLTNRKISSVDKKNAKVLKSFDGMICAIIFPHSDEKGQIGTLSELVRCTPETKELLIIRKT